MARSAAHRIRNLKGLTLVELLISGSLMLLAIAAMAGTAVFLTTQASATYAMQNVQLQISHAFDDMRLRCLGATGITTTFSPGGSTGAVLTFFGESDPFVITPDNLADNVTYTYRILSGALVRQSGGTTETLIEARFQPGIEFRYTAGHEPNFLTVTITATSPVALIGGTGIISKTDSLEFWFINAVA